MQKPPAPMLDPISETQPEKQRDRGVVRAGAHLLKWNEHDDEIRFELAPGSKSFTFGEIRKALELTAQQELEIMNQLLVHYRPYGFPDGGQYYTVAAGITDGGHLYIEVTNQHHIVEPFAGRGCAETRMLGKAQHAQEGLGVEFEKVYLMAGIGTKRQDGTIEDRPHQPLGCLCGECRQNLRQHTRHSQFIMIPANDGSMPVMLDNTQEGPLSPTSAWVIGHNTMFPIPEYEALGEGSQPITQSGHRYITDTKAQTLPLETALSKALREAPESDDGSVSLPKAVRDLLLKREERVTLALPQLEGDPGIETINRAMLQLMKDAYAAHAEKVSEDKNLEISVVLLKNHEGQFFAATLVDGKDWLPAKPPAAPTALNNAFNQKGFSEVYVMTFNDRQLREEAGAGVPHQLKMPNPATLNRIIKNLNKSDNPPITVLPVNDGTLSAEALQELAVVHNTRAAFGPNYINPKMVNELKGPSLH